MDTLINYFNSISTAHRSIFLIGGLAFFLILESGIPLFRFKYKKGKHLLLNLFFTLTTLVINLIGAALILKAADYNAENNTGLLNLFEATNMGQCSNWHYAFRPYWCMAYSLDRT